MAALARRMQPRGGTMLAVAAVLIAAAILAIGYLALSALRSATGAATTVTPAAGLSGVVAVAAPAVATPIDLARFHATAEAGLNRSPEQRQALPPTPTPPPAATKPSA